MAFSLINSAEAYGSTGGTTSSIDTTGADLFVIGVGSWSTSTDGTESPSDSKSNTWNGLTLTEAGSNAARMFWADAASNGTSHTFTYSDITSNAGFAASAWSGAAASPVDQQNGSTGTGTSQAAGSVTPTEDDELVVTTLCFDSNSGGVTVPTGFTLVQQQEYLGANNMGYAVAYKIQTTATTVNPTWGTVNSVGWAARVTTFKAAAGGGGGRTTRNTRSHPLGIRSGINWRVVG